MTKRPRPRSSVWSYFTVDTNNQAIAICKADSCKNNKVRRGKDGAEKKDFSTKALWLHLQNYHARDYDSARDERSVTEAEKLAKVDEREKKKEVYSLSTVQLTLSEINERSIRWNPDKPEQILGEKLLVQWMCDGLLPYSTVSNAQFQKMISHLNKRFIVPSEITIRQKLIPNLYRKVQYKIKQSLDENDVGVYSITTDIWSNKGQRSFISYTVHYINDDWQRKIAILRRMPYDSAHTGESIAMVLTEIRKSWCLQNVHCLVRDNAANLVKGSEIANQQSVGCMCHILHLIVKHAVLEQSGVKLMRQRLKKLIKKLRRPKASAIVRKFQQEFGTPEKCLTLCVETKWNSDYLMFERAIELKRVIRAVEDDAQLKITTDCKLTPTDWDIMPKVIQLLKPIFTATLSVEGDLASISDIIPITKRMKMELEQVQEFGIRTLKSKLLENIHKYLEGGDTRPHFVNVEKSDVHAFATLLDPRYKGLFFQSKANAENAKLRLKCEAKDVLNSRNVSETTFTISNIVDQVHEIDNESRSLSWEDCVLSEDEASVLETGVSDTEKESTDYFSNCKRITMDGDSLMFWKLSEKQFPILSLLAIKYLCPPASSSTSEREFSIAGIITYNRRIRLLPTNTERLLFLKYNLRAIGWDTQIPQPPESFSQPNDLTVEMLEANLYQEGNINQMDSESSDSSDGEESDEIE